VFTVVETPEFIVWASRVWSDEERQAFIDWISVNPDAGAVMQGSGGLRKVRWSRKGMGKRGGARVIYHTFDERGEILLLLVYAKARFDSISTATLKAIKEKFDAHKKSR